MAGSVDPKSSVEAPLPPPSAASQKNTTNQKRTIPPAEQPVDNQRAIDSRDIKNPVEQLKHLLKSDGELAHNFQQAKKQNAALESRDILNHLLQSVDWELPPLQSGQQWHKEASKLQKQYPNLVIKLEVDPFGEVSILPADNQVPDQQQKAIIELALKMTEQYIAEQEMQGINYEQQIKVKIQAIQQLFQYKECAQHQAEFQQMFSAINDPLIRLVVESPETLKKDEDDHMEQSAVNEPDSVLESRPRARLSIDHAVDNPLYGGHEEVENNGDHEEVESNGDHEEVESGQPDDDAVSQSSDSSFHSTFDQLPDEVEQTAESEPVSQAIERVVVASDQVSFFRALLAYTTKQKKWVDSQQVTPKNVMAALREQKMIPQIVQSIQDELLEYRKQLPSSPIALRINSGGEEALNAIALQIFHSAITPTKGTWLSVQFLRQALLTVNPEISGETKEDLKMLGYWIYANLIVRFEVPESTRGSEGILLESGRFSLMVPDDYFNK